MVRICYNVSVTIRNNLLLLLLLKIMYRIIKEKRFKAKLAMEF